MYKTFVLKCECFKDFRLCTAQEAECDLSFVYICHDNFHQCDLPSNLDPRMVRNHVIRLFKNKGAPRPAEIFAWPTTSNFTCRNTTTLLSEATSSNILAPRRDEIDAQFRHGFCPFSPLNHL